MKLLVLAQTPPPAHGQSLAVQALIEHLRQQPDWEVHHVNLPLSRDTADIGRWRIGKLFSALAAVARVWRVFARHGRMPLYYVPAPAKRSALYRDWLLLALCRPFARGVIFHWHGVGLGAWLDAHALGQLAPKAAFRRPCAVLFLGLGTREKGLFDALEGVALANAVEPGAFRFTAAGAFSSADEEREFRARAATLDPTARHLGFVSEAERNRLLRESDLLCFPSYYAHEGQPAVLLEALAHDLPIVTTRWRGIPEQLPARFVYFVEPRQPAEIAAQLRAARDAGPPHGALREHFLEHFTQGRHLACVEAALRSVAAAQSRA